MTTRRTAPLHSGGFLWGPERVRLGISIRELAMQTGIARGMLSLYECGRMVPPAHEYDAVLRALREAAVRPDGAA